MTSKDIFRRGNLGWKVKEYMLIDEAPDACLGVHEVREGATQLGQHQ